MFFEDAYKTIFSRSEGLVREKGSRFIAFAIPLENEDDVKKELAYLKNEFHDATHYCYAYILGSGKETYRFNDDGEPSGTAGRPILSQIQSKDLTNVLVVVVRYYGGIKLGVRGLINAYKSAAFSALDVAEIVLKTVNCVYEAKFNYMQMNKVMSLIKEESLVVIHQKFDLSCRLQFYVKKSHSDRIEKRFLRINDLELNYLRNFAG